MSINVLFYILSYFSFQPVLHDWYNNVHGRYYPFRDIFGAYKRSLAANQKEELIPHPL